MFTSGQVPFFFDCLYDHWAGNMGGTRDPLICLLLSLIVLILEVVLVPMGENELILIRVVTLCLTRPTKKLLWTANPLIVEEDTLKLLGK